MASFQIPRSLFKLIRKELEDFRLGEILQKATEWDESALELLLSNSTNAVLRAMA